MVARRVSEGPRREQEDIRRRGSWPTLADASGYQPRNAGRIWPEVALAKARSMVPRVKSAKLGRKAEQALLQFIETVIVHQFPKWSRAEIEKMLQVTDMRKTRVYQEGVEEGEAKRSETIAKRLLQLKRPITEIAEATGLTPAQIRKLKK